MKRIFALAYLLLAMTVLQGVQVASAKGPPGISNGVHNLSDSNLSSGYKSDEPEVCVFCHTPHGASSAGPLWNKPLATGPFTHYTTDAGANAELQDSARPVSDQSLLCLSCHDGVGSVNSVINLPNSRGGSPIITETSGDANQPLNVGFGAYNPVLDVDLTNDHPISFSYDQVLLDFAGAGLGGKLRSVAAATTSGVRFFGGTNYIECSTCHDPHVDYSASGDPSYTPFLITPNTSSALCLACHVK